MLIQFDIPTITGILIALAIVSLIMFVLNKFEAKMDVKLAALEEAERKRVAAERAAKRRGGSPSTTSSVNPVFAAAAVAAVEQFRKENA